MKDIIIKNSITESNNTISLTDIEATYLKLYVHNFSKREIILFLGTYGAKIVEIRKIIEYKFKTKDWLEIVRVSFNKGLLNKEDITEENVKKIALLKINIFFLEHQELTFSKLNEEISDFYFSCERKLKFDMECSFSFKDFTEVELKCLELHIIDIPEDEILEELNIDETYFNQFKKKHFYQDWSI